MKEREGVKKRKTQSRFLDGWPCSKFTQLTIKGQSSQSQGQRVHGSHAPVTPTDAVVKSALNVAEKQAKKQL